MRNFKKLAALFAVIALSAIGAANASAATFTASATGSLSGKATNTQVFKTGGSVECTNAATTGSIVSTASTEQHVTVNYSGCKAFGFVGVDITPATYVFTANGLVHIKNTITINATGAGCHQTVAPQTGLGTITYTQSGVKLIIHSHVKGISWTGTGGFCGTSGTEGTYSGTNEVERVGGGSISWDK